jgi:hypothetical protein
MVRFLLALSSCTAVTRSPGGQNLRLLVSYRVLLAVQAGLSRRQEWKEQHGLNMGLWGVVFEEFNDQEPGTICEKPMFIPLAE